MLSVLLEREGFADLEISEPHMGQRLTCQQGGALLEAHAWWDAQTLARRDMEAYSALVEAVPLADRLTLARAVPGEGRRVVFRGVVVETGTDGERLFISAEQPG